MSLEDGHLGQATPHDILYVHCKLLHLNLLNVICREINFDSLNIHFDVREFEFHIVGKIMSCKSGSWLDENFN